MSDLAKRATRNRFTWIAIVSICFFCAIGFKLYRLGQKQQETRRIISQLKNGVLGGGHFLGNLPLPRELATVPFAEDSGLVVAVKEVKVRTIAAPYNPGLIESKASPGYDLIFRYDKIHFQSKYAPFFSHIGKVHLNAQFEQDEQEFKKIELSSDYAEDPRLLLVEDQLFMVYNVLNPSNLKCRLMQIAHLDRDRFDVNYTTTLDMNLQWVEKNWTPFEYAGENDKKQLFFEYQISPRKLLHIPDPRRNDIANITLPKELSFFPLAWQEKWGQMRGGTPAKKVGDEYLGFFHSSFFGKDGTLWYVMGAYTFEAAAPFRLTGVSHHPILFREIFSTPHINTAPVNKRVIFPSGFVVEKQKDRELIHLACGENDSTVKIVTLDKEKLIKSLNRF